MINIGIITQPLCNNYGGILQNYALQVVLKRLGYNPYTVYYGRKSRLDWFVIWLKYWIKCAIRHPNRGEQPAKYKMFTNGTGSLSLTDFVTQYINTTQYLGSKIQASKLKSYNFRGYVVGSDQVWRPKYNTGKRLGWMFLDFVRDEMNIKRVAYAASFGVDLWEYTDWQTTRYERLIKLFDAVSVREVSGISLCDTYFNINAIQVLDPTLLLTADDYRQLIAEKSSIISPPYGDVLIYMLDKTENKMRLVDEFCKMNNLHPFYVGECDEDGRLPSIESWLIGFNTAKYVITDSFHGSVFSIIFNKPFVAIGNSLRGLSRFHSLLSTFGLENNLVDANAQTIEVSIPDWDRINKLKVKWQEASIRFLEKSLKL